MQVVDGKFADFRWKSGAWDLESDAFKKDGKTNWDLVISLSQKHMGPVSSQSKTQQGTTAVRVSSYSVVSIGHLCLSFPEQSAKNPEPIMPQPTHRPVPSLQVIDAEMGRRRLLEDTPIASTNEDPVFFDTDQIPWWAWVKRFHLPEVGRHFTLSSRLALHRWRKCNCGGCTCSISSSASE